MTELLRSADVCHLFVMLVPVQKEIIILEMFSH